MSPAFRGKPDANAEQRLDLETGGAFHDQWQFVRHFEDDDHLESHFDGAEGEVDELAVLVAVADDEGLGVVHVGERGEQFRFAAGLESVMKGAPEARHLADHLVLLVDLDWIDSAVASLVLCSAMAR